MNYRGTIIEESLENKEVLKSVNILETKVKRATEHEKTPWLKQWTFHTVEIPPERAKEVAMMLSHSLDQQHQSSWYADFKNDTEHIIIFRNKIFRLDRSKPHEYAAVTAYGMKRGIPEHQLDFSSHLITLTT
ncbi:MAG: hypothetical protein HY567_01825 [Candidatus Kerfeldbacteria bacterium]|nr:hypothetical protein [Candidatus Kerfeldbacteria bacterium]